MADDSGAVVGDDLQALVDLFEERGLGGISGLSTIDPSELYMREAEVAVEVWKRRINLTQTVRAPKYRQISN